jgi:hypothetical protein
VHVLAAAGVFRADGVFVELPPTPRRCFLPDIA